MNKHLYRIIFNQRRGQMMVVAENAPSSGKAASGEGDAAGAFNRGPFGVLATALRPLYVATCAALGVAVFAAGPSHAQVKADPNAAGNQRPTVLQTTNGVPLVNIQTPSAAGVSRNTYSQFDITSNGAVLNNSRTDVQSQIGGWVQGNPWLQTGPARVILNEVNSANPSQLRGYVEVAGQRAEVIIANPSGVQVDGGGFINASRVTITTGTAQLNNGTLESYLVRGGTVSINGLGLDVTQADFTAILARALQINAGVWAKELQLVTGANQIAAAPGGAASATAAIGTAPVVALDVAQLGGMYAGKITMIGTEAGLGVRNAGVLAASSGNLVLDANGWLSNSGSLQATGQGANASIRTAGAIANTGTVYAAADTSVTSGGELVGIGMIAAKNNTSVHALSIEAGPGAVFASGMNADGSLGTTGKLSLSAAVSAALHGTAAAAGGIEVIAPRLDLSGARVFGDQIALTATDGDLDASAASISAQGTLALGATGTLRTNAAGVTANTLRIGAHDLTNIGGQISQFGSADLALTLPGILDNTRGQLASNSGNLTLNATTLLNRDGLISHAGTGTLAITATALRGARGQIDGNGSVTIKATDIDHRGASVAAQTIALTSSHLDNSAGRIVAARSAAIGGGDVDNTDGTIAAGTALSMNSANLDNTGGSLQALGGDLTLRVAQLHNAAGGIYARGDLDAVANSIDNSGSMYAAGGVNLSAIGALANSGVIAAQGNATIGANSIFAGAGSLLGAGVMSNGAMAQRGDLNVNTIASLAAHGQNLAASNAILAGAAVDLSGSQTSAANVTLNASAGDVTSADATVTTPGTLAVTARASLLNQRATLSAGQLVARVSDLDNSEGTIIQIGTGDTSIGLLGTLNNTAGRIAVNSDNLTLDAATLINTGGAIEHSGAGTLAISADAFNGAHGTIIGNGGLSINAGAINHDGASTSAQTVRVKAASLSNRAGRLLQSGVGGMTFDVAGLLDNSAGEISGLGALAVQAGALDNDHGRIAAGASAAVVSQGALNNTDGVFAAANAMAVSAKALDNTRGTIQAGSGALTLNTGSLINSKGTLASGTSLTTSVAGDLQNDGVLYSGRDQTLNVGGTFINTGSVAAQGDMTLTAGSIQSDQGSLLGAGIHADGSMAQSGKLTLSAASALRAGGTVLAAGDAVLSGASVDLDGSRAGADNVVITATGGGVSTAQAQIGTAGALSVSATHAFDNHLGNLNAGQLTLNVASLNNDHGVIVQSGLTDSGIMLDGTLDNTFGRIAVNSANLTISAGVLLNTDGNIEHAGTGTLAINAATLDGQRGRITTTANLAITAGGIDHRGGAIAAQRVTIAAANLNNSGGQIAQLGNGSGSITVDGSLANRAGAIESNGAAAIATATLDNSGGRIAAAGNVDASAGIALDNAGGVILAGASLRVSGGDVDNTGGSLQALAGNATLNVADLNNNAGSVYAAGNLDTNAANVANSGKLYAAGHQRLSASGTLANSGLIAAHGNTTIGANSLDGTAGSLLGAGINAEGSMAQAGDLIVTTARGLVAKGQNLAAGNATLTGAALDLSGSQTGAANIALNAGAGNVGTAGATVATAGTLALTAGGSLVNTRGTLSAGQLAAQLGALDNTQGTILQSGAGNTAIAVGGILDNTAGRIALNGVNLTLGAGTLVNIDGSINHAGAGTLALTAATLNDTRGSITGDGAVNINAGAFDHSGAVTFAKNVTVQASSLDNRGGHLLQGGGGTIVIDVAGQLDNGAGEIAGNGILALRAGALENDAGRITSGASATVSSQGALINTDGLVQASGALTLSAGTLANLRGELQAGTDLTVSTTGDLLNGGVLFAGRDQALSVGGAFINSASALAVRDLALSAGSVQSGADSLLGAGVHSDGTLAPTGKLTVNAAGALQAGGTNLAAGDMVLRGASVDLRGSRTGATNIAITASGGDVKTAQTEIGTAGTLSITAARTLDNHLGKLTAGQLALNAADLNNEHGVIVQSGEGDTGIALTGTLDNTSGRIAADGANLALGAGTLVNTDGIIEHAGIGTLAINAATLSGQRGQITGNGSLAIAAGSFDHRDAAITAQRVAIAAASLDNRGGRIAQLGGGSASITASGNLDNRAGAIVSNGDASVTAAALDNSGGRIAAVGALGVNATINNTAGFIAAGTDLSVSGGNVDNTGGTLQAIAGNASLNIADLNNAGGSMYASGYLTTSAANVVNSGQMYAAGSQSLSASGALVNTGVIAAQGNTTIGANSLTGGSAGLLAAGLGADGILTQSGNLNVTTVQALSAKGQNLAAGSATLKGGSVDLGASQTSAANIALNATAGNVTTADATVTTAGTLAVSASGALINARGDLSAGQLVAHVAGLDNTLGTIIQNGAGNTAIALGGTLDNTSGRIVVNSANLTLGAGTLVNTDGTIEHAGAGTLAISAATLNDARGTVTGNGGVNISAGAFNHNGASTIGQNVNIQAASLTNRAGHLQQGGIGAMTLNVTHLLDNASGEIAGNGALTVQAGALDNIAGSINSSDAATVGSLGPLNNTDGVIAAAHTLGVSAAALENTRGAIQAGAGALTLNAVSVLNNQGTLSAGTDLTASTSGDLSNAGVMYAGRDQTLNVGGILVNTGSLAALRNTTVTANSVASGADSLFGAGMRTDGTLAQTGNLTMNAVNALQAGGTNLAAGNAVLRGAAVDLGGSQTNADNIAITASSGNVVTALGAFGTASTLNISAAQTLDNREGALGAGQLILNAANLNNDHGRIVQSGAGNTAITLAGTLDNTSGRIALNSANLTLGAGTLINTDGVIEHAGAGTLAINATTLSGQRGQITANGELAITAGSIDHRDAATSAQRIGIAAASLDNRAGQIVQLGNGSASLTLSGNLDNRAGAIESYGDTTIAAATIDNSGGRIAAVGAVGVSADAALTNTAGFIAAGTSLSVSGGNVDNTSGDLQALSGNATLNIASLDNTGGSVYASGNLNTSATNVTNTGSLYAAGTQTLAASGALVNSGTIAAQGNTTISANSLDSGSGSLLAAGIGLDGAMAQAGALSVTASQGLSASGQNLAAGSAILTGATVNLSGSQTSAGNIALNATTGNVTTTDAALATAGTLSIAASDALVNRRGTLSAGQLVVQAASLDNTQGVIVQSGSGNTAIAVSGAFDNTAGQVAVNSTNLTLGAGTLVNTDGRIEHAGSGALTLNAASLNDARGQITGNGSLTIAAGNIDHTGASTIAQQITITAANLDNRLGDIKQLGLGATSIGVTGTLDNRGGIVASNGGTTVGTGNLLNQSGIVQAAGAAALAIGATGTLDNSAGLIAGGANTTLSGNVVLNHLGQVSAGGTLGVSAVQGIHNVQGLLVANGALALAGATLDNTGGQLASLLGDVSVTTGSVLTNDSGVIQAAGDIALHSSGLSNTQTASYAKAGAIVGNQLMINTSGQALDNHLGTIAATQAMSVTSGALNNDAGLLQAGSTLVLGTNGNTLTNTNAGAYAALHPGVAGGIVSGGTAEFLVGTWNNAAGFAAAGGVLTGTTGYISNTAGGQIVGESSLTLDMAGLDNRNGQIQALGELTLADTTWWRTDPVAIDNRQGLIRSGGRMTMYADAIDNRNTGGAGQGIESSANIDMRAAIVQNASGAMRADESIFLISSGTVDNSNGLISAGTSMGLIDINQSHTLSITNTGGTMIGGQSSIIKAASLGGDGRLLSLGNISVELIGDYIHTNSGEITANGDVTFSAINLYNAGRMQAGGTLNISAQYIENINSGDISGYTTRLFAFNTITNRGVIDGVNTDLTAAVLNNAATGRVYGDRLNIAASHVYNRAEFGVGATIAAREALNIGTLYIDNQDHSLILSGGDMAIGGALDASRQATGRADLVTNASATIEALGSMNLGAGYVGNSNAGSGAGHIVAGGALTISADNVVNTDSEILAGGLLSIGAAQLFNAGPAARYEQNLADANTQQGKVPGALTGAAVNGATGGPGAAGADAREAAIVSGAPAASAVDGAVGRQAAHAVGAGGLNASDRTAGAGQNGQVGGATGARATVNGGAAGAGWTGAVAQLFGGASVANRFAATVAGRDGLDRSDRADGAGQNGDAGAVNGAHAALNGGASAPGSAGATGLQAENGVVNRHAAEADDVDLASSNQGSAVLATAVGTVTGSRAALIVATDGAERASLSVATAADAGGTAGASAHSASAASVPDVARVGKINQVLLANPAGGAQIVRTSDPNTRVPNASLYAVNPSRSASYLIETDPRFANYRQWLGSDYMLNLLQVDPAMTQKRLGDGYYEQSLVRAQVAQLTGRRFLGEFTNDDDEYRALMDAGVAYAHALNLRPGIALSAAQMAVLSSDIVWLVQKDVTLADGSVQQVLVPQVYVRVREGDLDGSGGLLSGKDVDIKLTGDLVNTGTIAGRDVVRMTADNVHNLGGRVHGDAVAVQARTDLNNIGGAISANSTLVATAGRDINVASTTTTITRAAGGQTSAATGIERVAGLYVTGENGLLVASAGRDIKLLAGQIGNAGKDGETVVNAGRNIELGTVTTGVASSAITNPNNFRKASTTTEVGSQISAGGGVALKAGADIDLRASRVEAGGALAAQAGNDITLVLGAATTRTDQRSQSTTKSAFKGKTTTKTTTTSNTTESASAIASGMAGKTVSLSAGNDISVSGSTVTGVDALVATAGNDIKILTDTGQASKVAGAGAPADNVAGLYVTGANGVLAASAGRDITLSAGQIGNAGKDGATIVTAGRNIGLSTLASAGAGSIASGVAGDTVRIAAGNDLLVSGSTVTGVKALVATAGNDIKLVSTTRGSGIDKVAALNVTGEGGVLAASAGRDVTLSAAQIGNAGKDGATILNAGRSIELGTLTTTTANNAIKDANNYRKESSAVEVGSQIVGAGSIGLKAGTDINLRASKVEAGGSLAAQAGNNINVVGGAATSTVDESRQTKAASSFKNKNKTTTTRSSTVSTSTIASSMAGDSVNLAAGNDILVSGATLAGGNGLVATAGHDINLVTTTRGAGIDQVAALKVTGEGGVLAAAAGRDINLSAAQLANSGKDGTTIVQAGRNIALTTLNTGAAGITGDSVNMGAGNDILVSGSTVTGVKALVATAGNDINLVTTTRGTSIDKVAALNVTGEGGVLAALAGRDITLTAAQIGNTGKDGATIVNAGRNIELGTVTTTSTNNAIKNASNYRKESSTAEVGSQIVAAGSIALKAGTDIDLRASKVEAGAALAAQAGHDINLVAGVATSKVDESSQSKKKRFFGSQTITTRSASDTTSTIASGMAGDTVNLAAGNDINLPGAKVTGASALVATAGNDLKVESTLHNAAAVPGNTAIDRVAGLYVTGGAGVLVASAGRDVKLLAAEVGNAGKNGATVISAGRNIELGTLTTSTTNNVIKDANNFRKESTTTEVGSQIVAAGSIALKAGTDIDLRAANVEAGDALTAQAGNSINIVAGVATAMLDVGTQQKKKNIFRTKTTTTRTMMESSSAIGSNLSGDTVNMTAGKDIALVGSTVQGEHDVNLAAANKLTLAAAVETYKAADSVEVKRKGFTGGFSAGVLSVGYGKSSSASQGNLGELTQAGSVVASNSGNTRLQAGEQLSISASDIAAGKDLTLIGKHVELSAAQETSVSNTAQQAKSSGFSVGVTLDPMAAFKSAKQESEQGNNTTSAVGKGIKHLEGIADGAFAALTPVVVQAGSRSSSGTQDHAGNGARVSTLQAGGDLTILATGGSIASEGTSMRAEGKALLLAQDNIMLDVAHNLESQSQSSKAKGASFDNRSALFAGAFNQKSNGNGNTDSVTGTTLSVGGPARLATTTGDVTLTGSTVVATGDTTINAARNLTIESGQNGLANENHSNNKAIGKVVISDTERFAGYNIVKHNDNSGELTQVASNVASLKGNVTLTAGEKYTQVSSNVLADKDVGITAKAIDIGAAASAAAMSQNNSDLKIGAFARISSPLIDLANNVDAAKDSDGRLKTMQNMAAAANAYQVGSAVANDGVLVKGEVGIGFASASSHDQRSSSEAHGSTINAAGNVTLNSTDGDITVAGSNVAATKTLTLDSARAIVLTGAQSTSDSTGNNKSAGVEVGVGYSLGAKTGVYAYATANAGSGNYDNAAVINGNTHLAGDTVNLVSAGDTTLRGADVKAATIAADVGGKLAIESVQDTASQHNKQTNVGVRVQVAIGSAWDVSGSASQSKANGNSSAVVEQSGLFAGDGGYHVKADTVVLKGGAIASTNAENSDLTAKAISFENLENKMDYRASTISVSGGFSVGANTTHTSDGRAIAPQPGQPAPSAPTTVSQQMDTLGGAANNPYVTPPQVVVNKGSDSSTTYATLTGGKLNIGGQALDGAASLGGQTDAANANKAVEALPDLQKMVAEQKAMSAARGTVIAAIGQIAGDIARAALKRGAEATQEIETARNAAKVAQEIIDNPASTLVDKAAAQEARNSAALSQSTAEQKISDAQKTLQDWSASGNHARALKLVTDMLVGGIAGDSIGEMAATQGAPYAYKAIGDLAASKTKPYTDAERQKKAFADALNGVDGYRAPEADPKKREELTQAIANADATMAEYKDQYEAWSDGSPNKVALHALATAALSRVAGNSALDGARAGAINEAIAPGLEKLSGHLDAAGKNFIADLVSMGVGAAAGNSQTAGLTLAAEQNNRRLHPGDKLAAKTLAKKSGGRFSEQEIQDALRYAGLKDIHGKVIVPEETREVFLDFKNVMTGESYLETVKVDRNLPVGGEGPRVLLERKTEKPSNELIAYIITNTGGAASPYILTPGPTYFSTGSLPPAPAGTTRVTMQVDGSVYFPLVANCPAVSCTNGDPIANAISDPGTSAYKKAVAEKAEKDLNVLSALTGGLGALTRSVGLISELGAATTAMSAADLAAAARVAELAEAARIAKAAEAARSAEAAEAARLAKAAEVVRIAEAAETAKVDALAEANSAVRPNVVPSGPPPPPPNSAPVALGEKIGAGEYKTVYLVKDDPTKVIATAKSGSTAELQAEIKELNELSKADVPVVKNYGLAPTTDGQTGMLMENLKGGITVKPAFNDAAEEALAFARLGPNSVADLEKIQLHINTNTIGDFQVIITASGRVLVADPAGLSQGKSSFAVLEIIRVMLELAKKGKP
ncbi:hemagglutinin repeat-containing protein [Massilia sp. TSP1-1-2]|uniref:hemagglutinin repeat-containing protein n=1 Tax=Massilia sp. TSP1-1-2 TaxID=2804649 RepID=UPI003CEF197E